MVQERRILYEHLDVPDINTFDVFRQYDGYTRFEKAIAEYQPEDIAKMVMDSGLKGRGGAGFFYRLEMEFCSEGYKPEIPLLQRRRKRAGNIQQSLRLGEKSAPID